MYPKPNPQRALALLGEILVAAIVPRRKGLAATYRFRPDASRTRSLSKRCMFGMTTDVRGGAR